MANILCFYRDSYWIWETGLDAPSTYGMTEQECVERLQWGFSRMGRLDFGTVAEIMARARKSGTNSNTVTLDSINDFNRAGIWEGYLTLDEIYQIYCVEKRSPTEEDAQD